METKRGTGWLVVGVLVVALLLVMGLVGSLPDRAEAAPANAGLAAPTPVTIYAGSGEPQLAVFLVGRTINTSTVQYSAAQNLAGTEKMDVQAVTAPAASVAHTLTLQFSNDGVNWVDGANVVAAQSTAQNAMNQYAVFGQYARVKVKTANPTPVAVTVIGLGK